MDGSRSITATLESEKDEIDIKKTGPETTIRVVSEMSASESESEVPGKVLTQLHEAGLTLSDTCSATWAPNSRLHPRNWNLPRKLFDTIAIVFLEFVTTVVSNTGTTAATYSASFFGVSHTGAVAAFATTYLVGQALGSIVFPPFTESFGRKRTFIITTLVFAVFNVVVGCSTLIAFVIIGRFLCGVMSAIPSVVAGGSLEEMWSSRARIWAVHIWIASSVLGLAVAPMFATRIAKSSLGWPWIYHGTTIIIGIWTLAFVVMRESRPSQILTSQLERIKKSTGYTKLTFENPDSVPNMKVFAQTMLIKPIVLFFREPVVFVVTFMIATSYATIYLLTECISMVYKDFGFSNDQTSLIFLAIGIGLVFTIPLRLLDMTIADRRKRQNRPLAPEDKLAGFFIAAPAQAIAFWWFAWTVPPYAKHISPWISMATLLPIGFATNEFDNNLTGYLCDIYGGISGSALAPTSFFRSLLSGLYPLFAVHMFDKLGNNIATTILAVIATLYCGFAIAFWKYGKKLREMSHYAEAQEDGS